MFNNFIVKGEQSYVTKHVVTFEDTPSQRAWRALKLHVDRTDKVKEFILIGKLPNYKGKLVTHATVCISLSRF